MPKKPREMVTGPAAFENFKRLMTALLAVPKGKTSDAKPKAARRTAKIRHSTGSDESKPARLGPYDRLPR